MFAALTDLQWQMLEPLFRQFEQRKRGKPHAPWRFVLNSILLVLLTGTKWGAIPESPEFASKSATHRWFLLWKQNGFLDQILGLIEVYNPAFPPTRVRLAS